MTPAEQAVIDAARAWRAVVIPNTSTAPLREHAALILAVNQLGVCAEPGCALKARPVYCHRHARPSSITTPGPLDTPCEIIIGHSDSVGYGSFRRQRAHTYVWTQANGPIPKGLEIRHRCDVRMCIRLDHMELGTRAQNMMDMVERGRSLKGERQPNAKLTEAQARHIILAVRRGVRPQALADQLGVSVSTVKNVKNGHSWKHLCRHPRAWHAHHADGRRVCGTCGVDLDSVEAAPEPAS